MRRFIEGESRRKRLLLADCLDDSAAENKPDRVVDGFVDVEHPFGTIQGWIGRPHFRSRKLANTTTEMSLKIPASNLNHDEYPGPTLARRAARAAIVRAEAQRRQNFPDRGKG
jgi:hypothetical protein